MLCLGCGGASERQSATNSGARSEAQRPAANTGSTGGGYSEAGAPGQAPGGGQGTGAVTLTQASLSQTGAAEQAPATSSERKIIRNASLSIEVDSPSAVLPRMTSLAESLGGYVVSSEASQQEGTEGVKPHEVVTAKLRVPARNFDEAIRQVRALGSRVTGEQVTGEDVTEEYIDLEARVRTQRALEGQYLEIMKSADTVAEALEVQKQLAEVRTEIERVEGRRRYLENQVSFSTITVTLTPPGALVNAAGVFGGLRDAFGDGLDIAVAVTRGLIRLALALVPILLFVVLPIVLLVRYILRRRRPRVAE
jgi:hypothetical protein